MFFLGLPVLEEGRGKKKNTNFGARLVELWPSAITAVAQTVNTEDAIIIGRMTDPEDPVGKYFAGVDRPA